MCEVIMTTDGEVGTIAAMEARGWTLTTEDIHPSYAHWDFDALPREVCLCPVDVEKVLDRHGVDYETDPFGFAVAPLRGHW